MILVAVYLPFSCIKYKAIIFSEPDKNANERQLQGSANGSHILPR